MGFSLYYLVDQDGDIDGAKILHGESGQFEDTESAVSQAMADAVTHYSVEQELGYGAAIVVII